MKILKAFALMIAVAELLALGIPAEAQSNRHGGGNSNRGDIRGNNGSGRDGRRGDFRFHHGRDRVNFFFGGGFGYPYYYGYPYSYGYPYYGYPYGYAAYGYGYPANAYYSYDPQGVYQGRVVSNRRGTSRSVAVRVQQELSSAGYYQGEIDGIIGDGTRRAIRNYERDNNLRVDGRIDDELLATMGLG